MELISPAELHPNDYNPNALGREGAQGLVLELRAVRVNRKPILVREVGGRLVIVDGEQTWRAANEAGLEKVWIERIDADEFEARRLTFCANLGGDANPLKLGRMMADMLRLRPVSNVELASALGCSEGTVRNRLLYVELAERARTDPNLPTETQIAKMTVKKVRKLLGLDEKEGAQAGGDEWEKGDAAKARKHFLKLDPEARAAFLKWAARGDAGQLIAAAGESPAA